MNRINFSVSLPGQWNYGSLSATVVCVHRSIVIVVSPIEALILDVAEAFTVMYIGYMLITVANATVLGCPALYFTVIVCQSSSGALQGTIKFCV